MAILANCSYRHLSKQELAEHPELAFQLKHFLKQAQQKNWQENDQVFIVHQQNRIIGYARFVECHNKAYWLRGLYIDPQSRKQGLAGKLLAFSEKELTAIGGMQIICFALEHLDHFYQKSGYKFLQLEQLDQIDPELSYRYRQALNTGKSWLLMQKDLTLH